MQLEFHENKAHEKVLLTRRRLNIYVKVKMLDIFGQTMGATKGSRRSILDTVVMKPILSLLVSQ